MMHKYRQTAEAIDRKVLTTQGDKVYEEVGMRLGSSEGSLILNAKSFILPPFKLESCSQIGVSSFEHHACIQPKVSNARAPAYR